MPQEIISAYFAPNRDALAHILGFIDQTKTSLDIALFLISEPSIVQHLISAAHRGLKIRIMVDAAMATGAAAWDDAKLAKAGIPLKKYTPPGGKMHNKFAISDDIAVLTGSFNWTSTAQEKNCENILIVREPTVVQQFKVEFERLWSLQP